MRTRVLPRARFASVHATLAAVAAIATIAAVTSTGCGGSSQNDYAGALTTAAAHVAGTAVYRATTGGCYSTCAFGTECDRKSGMCVPLPCRAKCPADQVCTHVGSEDVCVAPQAARGDWPARDAGAASVAVTSRPARDGGAVLDLELAHDSPKERATRAQLLRLVARYPVGPWLETDHVVVDEDSIPHSHPVLTLHTRHLDQDDALLATLLHEEMHWFLDAHVKEVDRAVRRLRVRYPHIAVGYPEGADSETSSYEHLLVNELELVLMRKLTGAQAARAVITGWTTDHYRALYRIVLEDDATLLKLLGDERLLPDGAL
jgi:hypothetical protein